MLPSDLISIRGELSLAEMAALLGVSKSNLRDMEAGDIPIPKLIKDQALALLDLPQPNVADERTPQPEPVEKLIEPSKGRPAPPYRPDSLEDCMKRKPLYGETSAETRAIRDEWTRINKPTLASHAPIIPLKPKLVTLANGRTVNAAIPDPVTHDTPDWAGPRGVRTKSGRTFDVETAHEMREWNPTAVHYRPLPQPNQDIAPTHTERGEAGRAKGPALPNKVRLKHNRTRQA
jgi:transcriptional regulator with XRE-family HTH domain